MLLILVVLSFAYAGLMVFLTLGILVADNHRSNARPFVSVIVAARNEAHNLPGLCDSLFTQTYPVDRYEVVIADDRSEDDSPAVLADMADKHPSLRTIRLENTDLGKKGKKIALTKAIEASKGDILLFTDADCRPNSGWISACLAHFTPGVGLVVGYSPLFSSTNPLYYSLLNLERVAIFAVSAGSLRWGWGLTGTGRNLGYRRDLWNRVGGFTGIDHIPSGDDDMMVQRLVRVCEKMRFIYCRDAFVPSHEKMDREQELQRETRRASKWRWYPADVKILTLFVMFYYLIWLVIPIYGSVNPGHWSQIGWMFLLKAGAELLLLGAFSARVGRFSHLWWFPLAELLYIPAFVFFGIRGSLMRYRWK